MTTYRCPRCHAEVGATGIYRPTTCPLCDAPLLPVPPKLLARPATPALDQLAIGEELETFHEYMLGLSAEGGQAR